MQRAVKLHPAVVMLALLAGGTLSGFFGLLLAVPATATLKILVGHAWRHFVLGQPLDEIEAQWERADALAGVGPVESLNRHPGPEPVGPDGVEPDPDEVRQRDAEPSESAAEPEQDRKSTRLNSSHQCAERMPSPA